MFVIPVVLSLFAACGSDGEDGSGSDGGGSGALTTDRYCDLAVAQMCDDTTTAECKAALQFFAGQCGLEISALMTCAGSNPTIECVDGRATILACVQQETALEDCFLAGLGGFGGG
jgi:hypothetical protein